MNIRLYASFALVASAAFLSACDKNDSAPPGPWYEPEVGTPERIAWDMDAVRYLNTAKPVEITTKGDATVYTFATADGPSCMRGAPYRASVRQTESEDLMIFMQGGGACWSDFCLATTSAPPGIPGKTNILNPTLAENPVRDWNVVYMPYCDGSLFVGDNIVEEPNGKKGPRIHAGLQNTSASLTLAHELFPAPNRILLAGSSGGGFGTLMVTYIVRYVWPDTPIYVMNDSGVGVAHDGDRSFIDKLIDEFGARSFLPADCPTCGDDGHIAVLANYLLERDDNVRIGVFTSWYDGIISEVFLKTGAGPFADAIDKVTTPIHEAHPERYRRFIIDDYTHTGTLGDVSGIVGTDLKAVELPAGGIGALASNLKIGVMHEILIGDLSLAAWLGYMLNDDLENWVDIQEERTPIATDEVP